MIHIRDYIPYQPSARYFPTASLFTCQHATTQINNLCTSSQTDRSWCINNHSHFGYPEIASISFLPNMLHNLSWFQLNLRNGPYPLIRSSIEEKLPSVLSFTVKIPSTAVLASLQGQSRLHLRGVPTNLCAMLVACVHYSLAILQARLTFTFIHWETKRG